jgi:effector-binding domain-containing protein
MRSARKIRRLFAESRVTVQRGADERISRDALTAAEESKKKEPAVIKPNIWRTIMRSRLTKLAAAAAIIIMAVVGGYAGYEALTAETEEREGLAFGIRDVTGAEARSDVIRADLIVRAKILEWSYDTGCGKLEVIKVLYGQAPATKVITCWHGDDEESGDDSRHIYRPGAEIIFGLGIDDNGSTIVDGYLRISSHGPYEDADEAEKRIIKWIEKVTQ